MELTIIVRPRVLIKTLVTAYKTDDSLPAKLLKACTSTLAAAEPCRAALAGARQ